MLAAQLGATGLGTYSTAMAFYGIIAVAGEAGATLFLIRELAKDKSRTSSYVVHLSALALGVSFVLTVGCEVVIRHVGYTAQVQNAIALVLLAILPSTLNSIQEAVFIVYGRTEFETIATFISSGIYLVASYWMLNNGYGVEAILAVYVAVAYLVTLIYYIFITRAIAPLRFKVQWSVARRLLSDIRAFSGSSALAALFQRPEIIILSLISSPQQVGYYSAAVRISEVGLFVPQVFMNNIYPLLTRGYHAGERRFNEIQGKAIKYALAYALPLSAGMLALAGPIVDKMFGPSFNPSVAELQLLAANLTLYTMMGLFWRSVSAQGRQDIVLRVQLVITVTRLASGVALIAPLASLGAAISATANSGLHVFLLERVVRRGGAPARMLRLGWRFALASVVMGGASWLMARWLSLWIVVPMAIAIYTLALVAMRAFPAEDVKLLRGMLPSRAAVPPK